MTKDGEVIFSIQIELLARAKRLLEDRIDLFEKLERSKVYHTNADSEKSIIIAIFRIRSIKLFKDTLSFLIQELGRTELKVHFFMLPNIRTLTNIYANFVHLLESNDENHEALICVAYQLLAMKSMHDDLEYKKVLEMYKNFLITQSVKFPASMSGLSFSWMQKHKLTLGKMNELLESDVIKKYSSNVKSVFVPKEQYQIYSALSEFLHGNPYYYDDKPHNERFWIAATSISTSAFLIEIIDTYFLKKINPKDFRMWLLDVKRNRPDFLEFWKSKSSPGGEFIE